MRQFTIGILCAAAFLAGCNKPPEGQAPESTNAGSEEAAAPDQYYTVHALPVTNAKITALAGTFQMLKVAAANGIPSGGRGGACLVFRAADLGFTEMAKTICHSNSDCTHLPPSNPIGDDAFSFVPDPTKPAHRENRFGYCEQATNQCWSKPITNGGNDKVCNRPITMATNTLNSVPKVPPIDVSEWVKPGARVRVVACLQKTGAKPGLSPTGTGCASNDGPDRIEDWGPFANVKP